MNLSELFQERLAWYGARRGQLLLVALSGGADSTALLLAALAVNGGRERVEAAHLDHGVRSDSAAEQAGVAALCRELGVPLHKGRLDPGVVAAARRRSRSLEAAMRELRYHFLRETAREREAAWVLTGHTGDDQAETVLFRAARRMDWRSLGGIPERRGNILRPLLASGRRETLRYCRSRGIEPLIDPTNYEESYARARMRHRVIPGLEGSFHPGVTDLLIRLGRAAGALAAAEGSLVRRYGGRPPSSPANTLERERLVLLPESLRRRRVLDLLRETLGEHPSARLTEDVLDYIMVGRNGRISLSGDFVLTLSYGAVSVRGEPAPVLPPAAEARELPVPGNVFLPSAGIRIHAEEALYSQAEGYPGGDTALIARDSVVFPLRVRGRVPGDRFRPVGMAHDRKLKDYLIDRKVPRSVRHLIPLVVDGEGDILWVAGMDVSGKVSLTGTHGEKAIRLRLRALSGQDAGKVG